jgi:hypothetical protein
MNPNQTQAKPKQTQANPKHTQTHSKQTLIKPKKAQPKSQTNPKQTHYNPIRSLKLIQHQFGLHFQVLVDPLFKCFSIIPLVLV